MFIGVDLGTTGCKAVLYDESGAVLSQFNKEYELITKGDGIFQDAQKWFSMVCDSICSVAKGRESLIEAISFSVQGISFVPVDRNGEPLTDAYSWMDTSATRQEDALRAAFGDEVIYQKTGKPLKSMYTLPKLMKFKADFPALYEKTALLLTPLDFLNLKFTGLAVTDYTCASGTMLYNINTHSWDKELLAFSGIDYSKLPEVQKMGSSLGKILPQVADALNLPEDTEIVLGGQDQKLAALGAGVSDDAFVMSIGTASVITTRANVKCTCPRFAWDEELTLYEAVIPFTGACVKWACSNLFGGISYQQLDALAEGAVNGSGGVRFDPNFEKGAALTDITLAATPQNLAYAVFEGICLEMNRQIKALGATRRLLVFGGGANSEVWCKILARVTGCEICILDTEQTASLGAAMLASKGLIKSAKIIRRIKETC